MQGNETARSNYKGRASHALVKPGDYLPANLQEDQFLQPPHE